MIFNTNLLAQGHADASTEKFKILKAKTSSQKENYSKRSRPPSLEFIHKNELPESDLKHSDSRMIIEENKILTEKNQDFKGLQSSLIHMWINKIDRDIKGRRKSLP